MLLHLAGHYKPAGAEGWLENHSAAGWAGAAAAVGEVFARSPAPEARIRPRLAKAGVPRELADEFVEALPGLRRFGDRWVRWGKSIADKAEAILHLNVSHTPVSSEIITAASVRTTTHER